MEVEFFDWQEYREWAEAHHMDMHTVVGGELCGILFLRDWVVSSPGFCTWTLYHEPDIWQHEKFGRKESFNEGDADIKLPFIIRQIISSSVAELHILISSVSETDVVMALQFLAETTGYFGLDVLRYFELGGRFHLGNRDITPRLKLEMGMYGKLPLIRKAPED